MKLNVIVGLMLLSLAAQAGIYKYVDAAGNVHYTDVKPSAQQVAPQQLEQVVVQQLEQVVVQPRRTPTAEEQAQAERYTLKAFAAENPKPVKAPKVVMYATDWCGYCKMARDHFKANGVAFTEYNIDRDAAASQRHKALGGKGVPLILIGDERMNGFSADGFDAVYQRLAQPQPQP